MSNIIPADQAPGWLVILPVTNPETGDECTSLPVVAWLSRDRGPIDGISSLDLVPIVQDPTSPMATDLYTLMFQKYPNLNAADVTLRRRATWVSVSGEVRYE